MNSDSWQATVKSKHTFKLDGSKPLFSKQGNFNPSRTQLHSPRNRLEIIFCLNYQTDWLDAMSVRGNS